MMAVTQSGAENIKNYVATGLHVRGLIPGRVDDEAGGGAMERADFLDAYLMADTGFRKNETVFEITYRTRLSNWLAIQPAFQYSISPSGDPALKSATLALIRVKSGF